MIMLYHITEKHRAEIRLENLHLFRFRLGTNHLWEPSFIAIITKGKGHHRLTFLTILISLDSLETKILLKTQRILSIFIWPSTQSWSYFLRKHLGCATCNKDMLTIILIHPQHKEFPTRYQLYLVKKHIHILEGSSRIHLSISLKEFIKVIWSHGEKTLIIKTDIEDSLLWHSSFEQTIDGQSQKWRLSTSTYASNGYDAPSIQRKLHLSVLQIQRQFPLMQGYDGLKCTA